MIINNVLRLGRVAKSVVREHVVKRLTRSPKWRTLRNSFLKKHPECAACGTKRLLQVHHIYPFHDYPMLELDETNLIVLCMGKNECHLNIGHNGNWKEQNLNVIIDVCDLKSKFKVH